MNKCKECDREYKRLCDLSKHINLKHQSIKEYYDKWFSIEYCKICGNEAKFTHLGHGYNNVCDSIECLHKFKGDNLKKGMIKKYGKMGSMAIESIKYKIEKTMQKRYGGFTLQSDELLKKVKKTNLKKYGVENPSKNSKVQQKIKNTNLKRYGVKNVRQNKEIKIKIKKTMKKRYGGYTYQSKELLNKVHKTMIDRYNVKYPAHNASLHQKQQISGFKSYYFKDTDIYYRGSYELDFLEKYNNKFNIINASTIKYNYGDKDRFYHPDFYIESLNLIVEIKNKYLAIRDKTMIEAKKQATLDLGYNYIMIVDKNYDEFIFFKPYKKKLVSVLNLL